MNGDALHHALKPEFKAAASTALLLRGCVNVIGLDAFKSEAGLRWPKLQPSIYAHLEALLRQKLGPTDFYVQLDDTSFMVTMPTVGADESQVFCLRIAYELHTSLLGKCAIEQLQISRATGAENDIIEIAPITGEPLVQLAVNAGLDIAGAQNQRKQTAKTAFTPREHKPADEFQHQFVPLWDAQKEAITTYGCVTLASHNAAELAHPSTRFKIELAATRSRLNQAVKSLAHHLAQGERFLMSVPISYDMLSSPIARMEISAICRNLSSELRPYLLFEISELPYGVPQSRLSELIGALRPFCRAVSAQLSARMPTYAAYQNAGLQAIGLSLSTSGVRVPEIESEIYKLADAAKRLHLRSFVLDVPSTDILQLARELGINLLSSPLIGAAMDDAAPIRRLFAQDIRGMVTQARNIAAPVPVKSLA